MKPAAAQTFAFAVGLAACGRVAFDEVARDSLAPDTVPADACSLGPFSAPVPLTTLQSASDDWGPWISPDKLEVVFASGRAGPAFQLFRSRRTSTTDAFAPPTMIDLGITAYLDDPFMSDDGLTLYFDSNLGGTLDLYVARRGSLTEEFAGAAPLTTLNTSSADGGPTVTSDELTLLLNSDRPGAGGGDMYIASRAQITDPFGTPAPIPELATAGVDCCASVSGDGNTVVFVSDRLTPGTRRLLIARRGPSGFEFPTLLGPELATTTGDEVDPTLSRDGTTIIFSSNRAGGSGGFDLYIAERSCL